MNVSVQMNRALAFSIFLVCAAMIGTASTSFAQEVPQAEDQASDTTRLPTGAATAAECVELFLGGMLDGNLKQSTEVSIFRTKLDRRAHQALVRFGGAADRFRSKFVKTYGQEAWETFNDPDHVPHDKAASQGANGSIFVIQRDVITKLAGEATANASESSSFTSVPNSDGNMQLVRQQGRWFVRPETLVGLTEPDKIKSTANLLGNMAVELERFYHAIGKPGLKPDDIDYQFGIESMRAMQMDFALRLADRFKTDTLPKPKPFEPIGELQSLVGIDIATVNRYSSAVSSLWKKFLDDKPDEFIQSLAPEMQPLVDASVVSDLRDRVKARWNGIEEQELQIQSVDWDIDTGYQVSGTIGTGDDAAKLTAYEIDQSWIGIVVESDNFAIDTRNLGNVKPLTDMHTALMTAIFNREAKKAYEMFFEDREPKGQHFESYASSLQKGFRFKASDLIAVRVEARNGMRQYAVHSTLRLDRTEEAPVRELCMSWLVLKDGELAFDSYAFGTSENAFILNEHPPVERFYRAIGNGDLKAALSECVPKLQEITQTTVFESFCSHFQQEYGAFKEIEFPQYSVQAKFVEQSPGVYSDGRVRFAKGTLPIKLLHFKGQIYSVSIKNFQVGQAAKIDDMTDLDPFARKFLTGLCSANFPEHFGMLSGGMQKELGDPQEFTDSAAEFRKLNGAVKSLKLINTEFAEDADIITMQYEIVCENRIVDGEVDLIIGVFNAHVDRFGINARKKAAVAEEAKPTSEE